MTIRPVSATFRNAVESSASSEVIVLFATITHPSLLAPIAVNSDIVDYVYNGITYFGVAFSLQLLSDDENLPARAQAAIQNVDQAIGAAVLALSDSPTVKIEILLKSDFDDSDPRQPIGTPTPEYSAPELTLQNVKCDAMALTADLVGFDFTTEPYPAIRSTQDRLPGLFR